jgi:hypothetical protein
MADFAIGGKISQLVVRIARCLVVHFMTGKTIRGGIRKIPTHVASGTIIDLVTARQREKQVVGCSRRPMPIRERKIMTIKTIRGISRCLVVGRRRGFIGVQMAIHTLIPDPVKTQSRL